MAIKELQTRIALKYDSYANWTNKELGADKGANFVLLKGEIGICEIPSDFTANGDSRVMPTVLFKVGNGTSKFYELPWASAKAADVYGWAKSETVVLDGTTIKFKTGDTVNHSIDLSSFATDAEVESVRSALASRIEALETSVGANGDIGKTVADHETRLDKLEGADTVEGSVANALKVAKAYTDAREVEIKKYADQAETDAVTTAKSYTDGQVETINSSISGLDSRLDVIEGEGDGSIKKAVAAAVTEVKAYADIAESDAVTAANSYTDTRETAIKTAYEKYADDAEQAAKDYFDGKLSTAVGIINAKDQEQDTEIGKKLDKTTYENYIADKEMSDEALKAYADDVASDEAAAAQSAAIAAAKTETEKQVKALADGQVETNRAAIAAMDTAYKAADTEIKGRLDTVEGKLANVTNVMDFRGAVEALPAVAGYQDGDVIVVTAGDNKGKEYVLSNGAWVEFGNTDANSAAISALQGRMTTAEGDIDKLEGRAGALEAADIALDQRLDAIEGDNGAIATGDAATLASAKSYAEEKATAAETAAKSHAESKASAAQTAAENTAKGYTDDQISSLKSTLEAADTAMAGDITALKQVTDGYTGTKAIKDAVDAKLATATFNTWTSEHEDGHAKSASEITTEITNAVNAEKSARETAVSDVDSKVAALTTRVSTAEGNITTLQGIVSTGDNSNAKLREAITSLQEITGDASKGNAQLRTELTTLQGVVNHTTTGLAATKAIADKNKTDIGTLNGKVEAIEADYLKAADVYIFNCGTSTIVVHEKAAN